MAVMDRESEQVAAANASGRPVVVFIHGLWLLASSWDHWTEPFEQAGYATVAVSWPDEPETVEQARVNPQVFAKKTVGQVADHVQEVIAQLTLKPAVVGHSFGGLLTQIVAGKGLSLASVAIDPAPSRGVLPLPVSVIRSIAPVLMNPLNRSRAITLTLDQFRYQWANAVSADEAEQLYEVFHVAAPGAPLFQAATANLNRSTEAKVDSTNPERGPLLLISGAEDHVTPTAMTKAAFKLQRRNGAVTEITEMANRGHSLTIDGGWREVADTALGFVKRFT